MPNETEERPPSPPDPVFATPLPAGRSVLQALAASLPEVPRVQLREPVTDPLIPVHLPDSSEMPPADDRPNAPARLQLHGEIARGGMGAILKGRDADLGRDVAVKVLLEAHRARAELVQRFVAEAQINGQLQHPGVAPVYELGQFVDGRPYFTMKLVQGQTLAALLRERPGTGDDLSRLLGVYEQVCQTVAYAHSRGVIHRDLKPANIMLGGFGEVQVMDWGLAKVLAGGEAADEARAQEQVTAIRTQRSQGLGATDGSESDTRAGSVLGTPAYMAPEQARGEVDLVDERADVFGLGAILCEFLTGRPPFTGKSAEAHRKAHDADLADAFRRLDGCVAGAELVALARRCLAAVPWERPRNAGEVAHAVTAYQRSVAERLRRAEVDRAAAQAKADEERKRRRALMGLAAAVLALVVVVGGGAAWWWQQRTARVTDVEAALAEADGHRDAGRWSEAKAALERAAGRLGGAGPGWLRGRLEQARRDVEMVVELDEIRLRRSEGLGGGTINAGETDARYAAAFRRYGIDVVGSGTEEAAALVRVSAVRELLVFALDDWVRFRPTEERPRLWVVANRADDDPWRRAFRQALASKDMKQLNSLAGKGEAMAQPPTVLYGLGIALREAGLVDEAVGLLRQAQRHHPGDFWINFQLGYTLAHLSQPRRPEDAVAYLRAAVALRPRSANAHYNLGIALVGNGNLDEAVAAYRRLLELTPKEAKLHFGQTLMDLGQSQEALIVLREAIRLEPDNVPARIDLGQALNMQGRFEEALPVLREAVRLDPKHVGTLDVLAWALNDLGRFEEALPVLREAIRLDPKAANPPTNLAYALNGLGRSDDAIAALHDAMRLDPKVPYIHHNLGVALTAKGDLDGAVSAYRQAIKLWPEFARAHCELAGVLRSQGRLSESLALYRRGHELGSKELYWPDPSALWARKADKLVKLERRLPNILKGEDKPADAAERLEVGLVCLSKGLHRAAAQFYREALQAEPALAADVKSRNRHDAARVAALIGSGKGKDAAKLGAKERAGWRRQALDWLRADLGGLRTLMAGGGAKDWSLVQQRLRHLQQDPALAGLRDTAATAALPADEREACRRLWADVEELLSKAQKKAG